MAHLMNIFRLLTIPGIYLMSSLPSVSCQLVSFSIIPDISLGPYSITLDHDSPYHATNTVVANSSSPSCVEDTQYPYRAARKITPFQRYVRKN